jgi:formate/nitrite transporter FocA (FNT family)
MRLAILAGLILSASSCATIKADASAVESDCSNQALATAANFAVGSLVPLLESQDPISWSTTVMAAIKDGEPTFVCALETIEKSQAGTVSALHASILLESHNLRAKVKASP